MYLHSPAHCKFALFFFINLVLAALPTGQGEDTRESDMTYQIKTTWDGIPFDHDPVTVTLVGKGEEGVEIQVQAPFFGIPGDPGGKPGEPFDKLYNYEVVEVFFADGDVEKPRYLEVELSPWGEHLVLLLHGVRNDVRSLLPLKFESTIESNRWNGTALVPPSYFPPKVTRFNAYAIHDVDHSLPGDPRRYESLFPTPKGKYEAADFHRLEYFQSLDFESLQPGNCNATLSDPWPLDESVYSEKQTGLSDVDHAVVSLSIKADKILFGGTVTNTSLVATMTVEGVSADVTAHVNIQLSAIFHGGSDPPKGKTGDPLPVEDMDQYETLRVYIANEERKILELVFSPYGHYDVRVYREPYIMLSRGHRLDNVKVKSQGIDERWTVEAQLPLYYLPAKISRFSLASAYGGTPPKYETTYSVTNAGICMPDLWVVKNFPVSKKGPLLEPALNEGYSDLWEMDA